MPNLSFNFSITMSSKSSSLTAIVTAGGANNPSNTGKNKDKDKGKDKKGGKGLTKKLTQTTLLPPTATNNATTGADGAPSDMGHPLKNRPPPDKTTDDSSMNSPLKKRSKGNMQFGNVLELQMTDAK
jgi:hypothetical protein